MNYEIVYTDNHPIWGGETRVLYGGELRDVIKRAGRDMEGLLEGTVSARIEDAQGQVVWEYSK